jgi:DHA3 family macrolide efflux protein-like MFS transporter
LQQTIDNNYAGRVFAIAGSVGNASIPGAMIIYGILLEKYDYQGLLMVSGLILMPLSIISFMLYKERVYGRVTQG